MRKMHLRMILAALVLLVAGLAQGQGVGASGNIKGTVTDPTGAVVPNATVTVSEAEKGFRRTIQTDNRGQYELTGLQPATYEVSAQGPGFGTMVQKNFIVTVGQTFILDFHMKVSSASSEVDVTTEAPVVDVERGHQADTVDDQYINNLPIDRRDYLTYTLLMPGVSDSQTLVGVDGRVRQTPQTGLSFYGSNGRGNNVTVDGGEFNGDSGAVLVNLSQDAVQEFQINRSNYAAELGAGSGASINIVSKSGTNDWHGSLYGFFRNDAMDARNPFAFTNALAPGQPFSPAATSLPAKDALSRQQYGATLGGPLQKDKTFFFLSYEGLRQLEQNAVPLLTNSDIFNPTAAQQGILAGLAAKGGTPVTCTNQGLILPAAICAGGLQQLLTINPNATPSPFVTPGQIALNNRLVNEFETNGGLFPFSTTTNYWSGRFDHTFNDSNQASLRYLYAVSDVGDPDVGSLVGVSRGSSVKQWTSSLEASWFHQLNARTTNEFRAQWNLVQFNVFANDPNGPAFDLAGFAAVGRDQLLPDFSTLRQYEFADNFTMVRGHHNMKMGASEDLRGDRTDSSTFFGPVFNFGTLPGSLISPQLAGASVNSLQAFSLGLPSFYQQGFGNPSTVALLPLTSVYWQDAWAMTPGLTLNYGLRYDLDTRYVMPTDHKNFAPRVSFAWDPFKDHKTVVRGGFGIFYSPTYVQIDFATKELGVINGSRDISNFLIPLTGTPGNPALNSAAIFQTLFAQGKLNPCGLTGGPAGAGSGACITPADLAQFGINPTTSGPLPSGADIYHVPATFHDPYSEQVSLGVERQISNSMSISANYIYVHTLRLPLTVNTNPLPAAPMTVAANGNLIQNWGAPQCQANPASCFANPLLLQNNTYESAAAALYQGGILELKKRFSEHYTLIANYTYSKAFDDTTDFNYQPFNQTNLAAERALSSFDQRQKITIAGILQSPWKDRFLNGFQLSPIFRYNSGHPFNLLVGSDINGDNISGSDRPAGAARNTGLGPSYADFDMRLARQFRITEKSNLQFTAEAFNLFNRTNYSSVNNIVGPNFGGPNNPGESFNVSGTNAVSPSTPLGFTAASAKREIQLGARFSF